MFSHPASTHARRFRVDLLLLLVAIAWGSTYLTTKELITPRSVFALLALRMLASAVVMAAIVAIRRSRLTRAELRTGVLLGLLLSAIFTCETFGVAHTSATNAGLIISLAMVFTPLLEAAVGRTRPSGRFLLAALISVVGVILLAANGTLRPPSLGDLLILAAAVIRAVHVTTMHRLTAGRPADSLNLTTVQLGVCALLFTALSCFTGQSVPDYLGQFDLARISLLVYLVVVCTVFAFFVQLWAVRHTSPSRVALLLGTEAIWAAIIGVTLAGDQLEAIGYLGGALILAGTALGRASSGR